MTHTHTHTPTHTHTYHCVIDTLVIVTDTHKHIHRVLCTYMTSYLPQAYRLSILIDKQALFINSWLIRLSVDNVLLINTRRLSILIDKSIPLSIGFSNLLCVPFFLVCLLLVLVYLSLSLFSVPSLYLFMCLFPLDLLLSVSLSLLHFSLFCFSPCILPFPLVYLCVSVRCVCVYLDLSSCI